MKEKIIKVSRFEYKIFLLYPFMMMASMLIFVIRYGWEALIEDLFFYVNMMILTLVAYYAQKMVVVLLAQGLLTFWRDMVEKKKKRKALLFKCRVVMYISGIATVYSFVMGMAQVDDVLMMLSWSFLGLLSGSVYLSEHISLFVD